MDNKPDEPRNGQIEADLRNIVERLDGRESRWAVRRQRGKPAVAVLVLVGLCVAATVVLLLN